MSEDSQEPTVLHLNMRELPFVNVDTFISCFKRKLLKCYESILTRFAIKSEYFSAEWAESPPALVDLLED